MGDLDWVLFDQNGTLLDPRPIAGPLAVADGDAFALGVLDDTIAQSMSDTLSGDFRPFPEYLRAALVRRLRIAGAGEEGLDEALEIASKLPPFPDSAEALDVLRGAGLKVGVVTNSATKSAEQALEAAGLADRIAAVVGADSVGAYKPDQRVYARALAEIDGSPPRTCLAAAHSFDILGAQRAGLRTAWVARKERVLLDTVPEPDFQGDDLLAVASAIAADSRT